MGDAGWSATSPTLLARLRQVPGDPVAWTAFVDRYGGKIYSWCRRWGLQEADARDVTQNVMLELTRQMRNFEYDASGSFRGWLKTVAYRAWRDYLSSRKRVPPDGQDSVLNELIDTAASNDLIRRLEEEADREILELAMAQVQLRVQPHIWKAFVLTAIEGMSGAEVAVKLGMQVGSVWVARSKVQKFLREEVRRIDPGEDEPQSTS
ncbi:MAG: sigma-70 family RNA polymerase sigma factor [Gemmataceae bacterium]